VVMCPVRVPISVRMRRKTCRASDGWEKAKGRGSEGRGKMATQGSSYGQGERMLNSNSYLATSEERSPLAQTCKGHRD